MINYDEFKKVEIRAGKILSAEKIPDTDKLLKLMVDFGEFEEVKLDQSTVEVGKVVVGEISETIVKEINSETKETASESLPIIIPVEVSTQKIPKPRQIVSGIALKFPDVSSLIGKTCMFVTNLEPRKIKGYDSNGMLFAVSTAEGGFSLLEPNDTIPLGTIAA